MSEGARNVALVNAALVVGIVVGLGGGLVVAGVAARAVAGTAARAAAESTADAAAARMRADAGTEREAMVRAAVDTVVAVAGERLGVQADAGSRELRARHEAFEQRVGELRGTMTDEMVLRNSAVEQHIGDVRAELRKVAELVASMQHERAEQQGRVETRLAEVVAVSAKLADTTQSLRQALANPKARGQWGERMADDVLRAAGLVEGISYRKQSGTAAGTIPDFTFMLPGGRMLHMDVKFPVDNYLRHLEADTDTERERHAKAFLRDVRGRVKELSGRTGYIDADATLDEVLLFIPNESVWAFIHEQDPHLIDVALGQKVVLCSPVSLFAVLAVIRQAVEQTRLARTSDEILQCLAGFGQQWTKFADALDVVVKRFDTAQRGLEEVTGPRRRQLERQLDRIEDLRASRGLPELPLALGDGEGEVLRRASGDVRPWGVPEAG